MKNPIRSIYINAQSLVDLPAPPVISIGRWQTYPDPKNNGKTYFNASRSSYERCKRAMDRLVGWR